MDWQWLFNLAFGSLCAVISWVVRMLWVASAEVRKDLHSLESSLHETYARRDDFREYSSENRKEHHEIKMLLQDISTRLGQKADR
jgi:hypothetical protein